MVDNTVTLVEKHQINQNNPFYQKVSKIYDFN